VTISERMIERIVRRILDQPLYLRLFADVQGDEGFTEVAGGGYAARVLTLQDWTITRGRTLYAEGPEIEFKFDGSRRISVLGAYLTDASMGAYWAKDFAEAKPVGRDGDVIPVKPIFKLGVVA
jgi:hypothetical protein